jgi:hypothetical protein
MANWVSVTQESMARGKAVHVLLDASVAGPFGYAVMVSHNGAIYATVSGISREAAMEHLEEQRYLPGLGGDGSWNAVQDRLHHRERDVDYEGSALEWATTHFQIGTWNWITTLVAVRQLRSKE